MSTEIYYFSGTGNSLFVAKELQKRIPEAKLIPIVSLLNQDTIKTQAEKVGIIFPLQGPTYPIAVKMFLEKIDLESADYIFAIATRGGTSCRIKEEIAYFGDIRTMIPELSGQHIGIIRTPYRNYPDTLSS